MLILPKSVLSCVDNYDDRIRALCDHFVNEVKWNEVYENRLCEEFDIIQQKNFIQCFEQVTYIVGYMRSQNIPHVLRGSGACSLVCYLLGITHIDPVKENMALARFMNFHRDDQPDIDLDVPHYYRDDILKHLYEKYPNRVARISNDVKYSEKTALREVMRKYGFRKQLPRNFKVEHYFLDPNDVAKIYAEADKLIGEHCHWSLHCGGIIVYDDKVPEKDILKDNQIKLTKYDVEEQNLIKIDLLCNRGLSQLWDIEKKLVHEYPVNDENVEELFRNGDVIGLTQAESRTMRKCVMAIQPKSYKDLALCLAIIRPAAADNKRKKNYFEDYTSGNKNHMLIYDDDSIYYIAEVLGCDYGTADAYRRAFKRNEITRIEEFQNTYDNKMLNSTSSTFNDKTQYSQLRELDKYSFCKGHALAYGQLVWALAYNKHYHAEKFWESTLKNNQSSYRKWVHIREAQVAGVFVPNKNHFMSSKDQFLKQGWWTGEEFLPGCFLEPYEDEPNVYMFRGIIANSRTLRKFGKTTRMITVGYDNGKFLDLIVEGEIWCGNHTIIQGVGEITKHCNCESMKVIKMWKTWFDKKNYSF